MEIFQFFFKVPNPRKSCSSFSVFTGRFSILFLFLIPANILWSQHLTSFSKVEQLKTHEMVVADHPDWVAFQLSIPEFDDPFISLTIKWESLTHSPPKMYLKKWTKGAESPVKINREPHLGNDSTWISQLHFFFKGQNSFELYLPIGIGEIENITLHWFYPGNDATTLEEKEKKSIRRESSCSCPPPSILERSQWCPQNNCPSFVFSGGNEPTHLIVHHTAGTNQATNWSAVVRSIWNQHVNVNGWSDIGYHYLIDPDGKVYQGRTDEQIGAHFCSTNSGTLGICVMGNFDLIDPSIPSLSALLDLVSAKSCEETIYPLQQSLHPPSGLHLNHISGHRDGCATQCPGEFLYPLLPGLRELADQKFQWICMDAMPVPNWLMAELADSEIRLKWEYAVDAVLFDLFELEYRPANEDEFIPLKELPSFQRELLFNSPSQEDIFVRIRAIEENVKSPWSEEIVVLISSNVVVDEEKTVPTLFPNPAAEMIYLLLPNNVQNSKISGSVFNQLGKTIKQFDFELQFNQILTIWIGDLAEGIYFLHIHQYPDLRLPFVRFNVAR